MSHVRWFFCNAVIAALCAVLLACSGGGGLITGQLPTDVTVTVHPMAVEATQNVMGTATISLAAPASGFKVILASDNAAVVVPAAPVLIPAGQTSANFVLTTKNVVAQTVANITPMLIPVVGGNATGAQVTVDPTTNAMVQSPLQLSVNMVKGGVGLTGTVTLTLPPTNPAAVMLTSSNPGVLAFPPTGGGAAVSPSSVQVATGNTVAQFQITTFPVAANTVVTITATLNNMVIAMVTVTP